MPKPSQHNVAVKLDEIKAQFYVRALEELKVLAGLFYPSTGAAALEDGKIACALLHRLAGSAGTFGFHELSSAAARLEQEIRPAIDAGSHKALAERLKPEFLRQLRNLRATLPQNHIGPRPVLDQVAAKEARLQAGKWVHLIQIQSEVAEELSGGLSRYGFEVVSHDDVERFLSATKTGNNAAPAAVITNDIVVGELATAMETLPPVIVLSSNGSFEARYRSAAAGARGFFPESVEATLLAERIEQLAGESDQWSGGKVLIIDDDDQLAEHYRLILSEAGFDVVVVSDPREIRTRLLELQPDIVLLDIHMAPYSGIALARMIRFQPEWLGLPIIYLSSVQDRDEQISAISQGADDFIEKPITDQRLVNVVRARCYRARQLAKLSFLDSLTGLLKHSLIKQELANQFVLAQRSGIPVVVAMLDLDHFKKVNDTYGHAAGDGVIKALAGLLRHRLRKSDIVGRYGGEEFMVILPECDLNEARRILQNICQRFSGLVFSNHDAEFQVTLSVGLAALNSFADAESALNAADEALYQRKQSGRDGVTLYSVLDDQLDS